MARKIYISEQFFSIYPEVTQNLPEGTQSLSEVTQNLPEVTQSLSGGNTKRTENHRKSKNPPFTFD